MQRSLSTPKVDLQEGEQVLFEGEGAVLTNRRLLVDLVIKGKGATSTEVALRDIASFQKINGGHESHLKEGLIALGAGVVLMGAQVLYPFLSNQRIPTLADSLLFLAGALALVGGLYFTLTSIIRVRPHTTILFLVPGSQDIPVRFAGRDNPKADQLTRLFARAKRGL